MREITYKYVAFGVYQLMLSLKQGSFISEPIMGTPKDAKAEINELNSWSLPDIWHIHEWRHESCITI